MKWKSFNFPSTQRRMQYQHADKLFSYQHVRIAQTSEWLPTNHCLRNSYYVSELLRTAMVKRGLLS